MAKADVCGLHGSVLDWAVARFRGGRDLKRVSVGDHELWEFKWADGSVEHLSSYKPSENPLLAHEIIYEKGIGVLCEASDKSVWKASLHQPIQVASHFPVGLFFSYCSMRGRNPLEAAMRSFVMMNCGKTLDIPDELLARFNPKTEA